MKPRPQAGCNGPARARFRGGAGRTSVRPERAGRAQPPTGGREINLGEMTTAAPDLDEPTMGLSPLYVDLVLALIRDLNRAGTTVFMVEQNANLALQIAHRGYVLQTGRIMLEGPAPVLLRDPRIRYLGGEHAA